MYNYISFVDITLCFLLGSKNKIKFGEIDIFRLQFPLIKLWGMILNSVSCIGYLMFCVVYGIYTRDGSSRVYNS